jgi:hypothetical protein
VLIQYRIRPAILAALGASIFILAPLQDAKAYDDYMEACRKWVGQGAGQQYKCFDCMRTITDASGSHWVNTCAGDQDRDEWSWH